MFLQAAFAARLARSTASLHRPPLDEDVLWLLLHHKLCEKEHHYQGYQADKAPKTWDMKANS